nr:hypothetical protein Iba_chr07dCG8330 [Ipomoea batatas]
MRQMAKKMLQMEMTSRVCSHSAGLVGEVSSSSSWIPISAFLSSSCCTSFNASSKSSIASLRANSASANSSSFFSNAIFISLAFFCSSTHFSSLVNIGSGSLLIRINSGSSSDEKNTGIRTCAEQIDIKYFIFFNAE